MNIQDNQNSIHSRIHPSTASADSSKQLFPFVLHDILEHAQQQGYDDVVSWTPCGRAFKVHRRSAFVSDILPRFFKCTKYKSFTRQLNLWCFTCIHSGHHRGAYAHPSFGSGDRNACENITRKKVKRKTTEVAVAARVTPTVTVVTTQKEGGAVVTDAAPAPEDGHRSSAKMDAANAMITADIMSYMEQHPYIYNCTNDQQEELAAPSVDSPRAASVSPKIDGSDQQHQVDPVAAPITLVDAVMADDGQVSSFLSRIIDRDMTISTINTTVNNYNDEDWADQLIDDISTLDSSFSVSLDDFSFDDILDGTIG